MIPLSIPVETEGRTEPFVVRLNADYGCRDDDQDAYLTDRDDQRSVYETASGAKLSLFDLDPVGIDGDVLLIAPEQAVGHRLIRASSTDNTLVFTERCDQRCVMCSQPPRPMHHDVAGFLEEAILLAPPNATLGISGGEPTLYKADLFGLLRRALTVRKDIAFHILTNGQHFEESDLGILRSLPSGAVTWGIPIYSADPETHDAIVRKQGAFDRLCASLEVLCRAGAAIELRTVLMALNADRLGDLAQFITTHVPFATRWAIMQLENIGYAEKRWPDLFMDSSRDFDRIGEAVNLARGRGISTLLYNFPLCTVPSAYRELAPSTISDWKRRYLPVCNQCAASQICCGFFEWYPEETGFSGVHPL